jgi:hypothetical protein
MTKRKVCVFTTDDRNEAGAVRDALAERGIAVGIKINTHSDLFGIRTISGPQVILSGTYQIMVEPADQESALEALPVILQRLDEESEYHIADTLPGFFEDPPPADDADILLTDRWYLSRAMALSLVPMLGFGLVPYLRVGRRLSRQSRNMKTAALVLPVAIQILYSAALILANRLFGRYFAPWELAAMLVSGQSLGALAHLLFPVRPLPLVLMTFAGAAVLAGVLLF